MTPKQSAILLARKLRKHQTPAESIFWQSIRNNKFMNLKFLRQHPIFYTYREKEKYFIADFYCRRIKLIIEIDGGIHKQQIDYDQIRSELLAIQHDLRVIRFTNEEIQKYINSVLKRLQKFVINKWSSSIPSPPVGGERQGLGQSDLQQEII